MTPSWTTYQDSIGDRTELFAAVAEIWHPEQALYIGSYLDLSPSTAIPTVTYVDTDRRAARFFANNDLVASELADRTNYEVAPTVGFLHANYTEPLPLPAAHFDLLISLFTTPGWDHCKPHMKPHALLLANTSHGEASLAALDPQLELVAVVRHRDGKYRLAREKLNTFLVPKNPFHADSDHIRSIGRGIAYTRSAFAYVFQCK